MGGCRWEDDGLDDRGIIVLNPEANNLRVSWTTATSSHVHSLDVEPSNLHLASKADLIIYLLRHGWQMVYGNIEPYVIGTEVFAHLMVSRARVYFLCLAVASDIFEKGAPCIHHLMPEHYYLCLLRLHELGPLHARADLLNMTNIEFRAVWKASLDASSERPNLSLPDHDEWDVGGDEIVLPQVPLPAPPAIGVDPSAAILSESGATVSFDHFSHTSGVQRGYITCRHHASCSKWSQVNQFDSKLEMVAYLVAWEALGSRISKEVHGETSCIPLWDDVDVVKASLI